MIIAVIIACEVGFWVLLVLGLVARYLLRWRRTSTALLVSVPVVDLILLAVTVLDLRSGSTATSAHGIAAVYIGFSVAYGHRAVRWADQRFAHRFADGPAPTRPPKYGVAKIKHDWMDWLRACFGGGVAVALLLTAILVIDDSARTAALQSWISQIGVVLGIWLLVVPVWSTVFPAKAPRGVVSARRG